MKVFQLRQYQQRIIEKSVKTIKTLLKTDLKGLPASILINSPCGSGKTYMALEVLKSIKEQKLLKDDVKIGWCAMRRNLLTQANKANADFANIENVEYVSLFDKNPPKVDILLLDECQHSVCDSSLASTAKMDPKIIVGLSATPYRTDNVKLCFHKVIADAGYRPLIEQGYLAKFNQYMLQDWKVDTVANAYIKDKARFGKSIMFFLTVDECNQAADILRAAGVRVDVVTAGNDNEPKISAFENDELDVLINVNILTEGFNVENIKSVFVRPSVKGPTLQMAGRGLRRLGDKVANIVQSKNTKYSFTRTATAVEQYIVSNENEWEAIGVNNRITATIIINRDRMVASASAIMPDLIIKRAKKNRRGRPRPDGNDTIETEE